MHCGRCTAWGCSRIPNRPLKAPCFRRLKHPSAGVRRNAVLALPRTPEVDTAILIGSSLLLCDEDAQVRLAALLALAEIPTHAGKSAWGYATPPRMKQTSPTAGFPMPSRWLRRRIPSISCKADAINESRCGSAYLDIVGIVAEHYAAQRSR